MKQLRKLSSIGIVVLAFLIYSCDNHKPKLDNENPEVASHDPLPSWNEGQTKSSIIAYVNSVTDVNSPDFVPVKDRIATFDNDGNLWSEQPALLVGSLVLNDLVAQGDPQANRLQFV